MERRHLTFASVMCDRVERELSCDGRVVSLTAKECALWWLLASQPERLISRSEIREQVWSGSGRVDLRTIDAHIAHLRRKLQAFRPRDRPVIQTIWGLGYRLRHPKTETGGDS